MLRGLRGPSATKESGESQTRTKEDKEELHSLSFPLETVQPLGSQHGSPWDLLETLPSPQILSQWTSALILPSCQT